MVGSRLCYTVRLGPWSAQGVTAVRHLKPGTAELDLEASFKPGGTARIFLQLRPWGEETLVVRDEYPLRGLGGTLHHPLSEAALRIRHRECSPVWPQSWRKHQNSPHRYDTEPKTGLRIFPPAPIRNR
ncbi:hypothetical protein ACE1OC_40840 [Streptomyces sp. DSM 116496]|uniref:hypothetical protein n=1 Tax=Streptomyces stoeckheimensis TaxID=3344656 RepID=UPI0038B29FE7